LGYLFWLHQDYKVGIRFYANGGLPIPKKKEAIMENRNFTCQNPSCGTVFNNPLKAEVVGSDREGSYDACPYCLAEIAIGNEVPTVADEKDDLRLKIGKLERTLPKIQPVGGKPVDKATKAAGCPHHLGYLSERAAKENIPEQCITCECIVQCMLKKITG
jgi:hypothetical protein